MSALGATALLILMIGALIAFPFEPDEPRFDWRSLFGRALLLSGAGIWIASLQGIAHQWPWLVATGLLAAISGPLVRGVRQKTLAPQYSGELEIAILAVLVGLAIGIEKWSGAPGSLPVIDPFRRTLLCLAGAVVVSQSGTPFVRGMLNKAGTLQNVGGSQLNAGRVIGVFERLLVFASVLLGQLELAGFLLAAKGFIRGRELESKDFSEYFILGTLASVSFAGGIAYLVLSLFP